MISPGEVFGYYDTQVRDVCHTFQGLVIQVVLERSRGANLFPRHVHHFALGWVERHAPVITPILKAGPIATDGEMPSLWAYIV